MEKSGLVSIIVPLFNAQKYVAELIESVKEQSYTNWELILVDDGSLDNSYSIANDYALSDIRIRVYRRNVLKKGAPVCRNIGIDKALGEFLIFLDADDIIANFCLEQRVSFMRKHLEYDFAVFPLIGFRKKIFDVDNVVIGYKQEKDILSRLIRRTLPFVVVTNIYRKDIVISNNLYWDSNLKSLQDSDYNITAITKGCTFKVSNLQPDYYWRIEGNENSISKKIVTEEHFKSHIYFFDKVKEKMKDNSLYDSDFLVLSNLLYKTFIFNMSVPFLEEYCGNIYFNKYPFLRMKLLFINKLKKRLNLKGHFCINLLTILLCPFFEIRFRFYFCGWYRLQKKLYKELMKSM